MVIHSDSVVRIVKEETSRHPNDIPQAVIATERRIRQLPEFNAIVSELITSAVRDLIYDERHTANVRIKNGSGYYAERPASNGTGSPAVNAAYESVLTYYIAGRQLGELLGEELAGIAEGERGKAAGHTFNAELLDYLGPRVAAGRKVRDVFTDRQLRKQFNRIYARVMPSAARRTTE